MSWTNIKLIFFREVRDQMRDRRTLFMIAILPMMLYPLMGMVVLKVLQFRQEEPTRIWLIGADSLPHDPPLIVGDNFDPALSQGEDAKLISLTIDPALPPEMAERGPRKVAHDYISDRTYDAVIYFPPQFAEELAKYRSKLLEQPNVVDSAKPVGDHKSAVPTPEIFADTANDKSRVAIDRIASLMRRWREQVVKSNLAAQNVPVETTHPFDLQNNDIAEESTKRAAIWSKILPFVLLVWALTGAFYPAIDLCAGEKERGTLETLLSSPAQRSEIVWGKLLTVMTFSMSTSLLNLCSMAATGSFVFTQMQKMGSSGGAFDLGPPPLASLLWLLVALIPISAMFSALSLAIAAFARSSKEGQYYLMPLLMFTMPLMIFPIMPATQLTLGTSIIPVTGVMFLLRTLMEGQYLEALRYSVPVIAVTAGCCLLAVRWAIDQFNNESVLFRESERLDLRLWLVHLVRNRGLTPTIGQAIFCGVLILIAGFFSNFVVTKIESFKTFVILNLSVQILLIAGPALIMALLLTSNPRQTLSLYWPRWQMLPLALLLAILMNPLINWLGVGIQALYPLSDEMRSQLVESMAKPLNNQPMWVMLLLLAVTPAICEELAFRGFMLSGLRHTGHRWAAIAITSAFFGITHGLLQQSLSAFVLGLVIGYLVIRSGSILTGMVFHVTSNSLMIVLPTYLGEWTDAFPWLSRVVQKSSDMGALQYDPLFAIVTAIAAVSLLYWLNRQPYQKSDEERLQQALDHQTPLSMPAKIQWKLW